MLLVKESVGIGIKPGDEMVLGESIQVRPGPGIYNRSPCEEAMPPRRAEQSDGPKSP
jgi:hypothetical protein